MNTAVRSPIAIEEFDQSYFQHETDEVYALPPACFTSEAFFQFEMNAVWKKQWFCVGRASDIPKAGDFFTFEVGDDALFAIRTREGKINVLSNVCRHRNMLLLEGAGNARRISCPLHAWVYNMEGELVSAPGMKVLRHTDYESGRFTNVFLSFNENTESSLELTYNWDQKDPYEKGQAFGHLALMVNDIHEAVDKLAHSGVRIKTPPKKMNHGQRIIAFVLDPDDYLIELIEPI